ncbi:MAG: ammonium transporter [Endomicrobium sp.]|jgi:Amt family ammonium transporter|nr:ammonium transporter [Endomicrobium sp.]
MSGDTGFILICAALVFIMTPGLALFYGGLGRRKNMVSNMFNSVFVLGLGIVLYALIGYSLSFGEGGGTFIGSLKNIGLSGITKDSMYSETLPTYAFIAFQMMFALITPAIITGSVAGRMKFKALFIFISLWSVLVYYPLAHMVWGGGLIGAKIGALDFAGGDVVHISSGMTGLILAIILGKRYGYSQISYRVHNIPFVMLGTGLLWLGWFGFNAGSALAADGLAAHAFMTTAISAAAACLAWMFIDIVKQNKPTMIGACTGVLAGLVGITPAAGFVSMFSALIIGISTSFVCYFGIALIKKILKIDDALDAFGCHGLGGIWGGIMTGVLVEPSLNTVREGAGGLIFGSFEQLGAQILGILATFVIVIAGTLIAIAITRIFTPLRVSKRDESIGLDTSEHGENAYPSFLGLD